MKFLVVNEGKCTGWTLPSAIVLHGDWEAILAHFKPSGGSEMTEIPGFHLLSGKLMTQFSSNLMYAVDGRSPDVIEFGAVLARLQPSGGPK